MSRSTERKPLRRVLLALFAALAMTLTMAACTAGTAASGGNAGNDAAAGGGSTKRLKFFPCCSWGTTWSFNPYNTNGLGIQNDFITLRLATQKYPSLSEYVPQLADSWTTDGGKLTVHLRDGATWQDDTPVTSQDLYDTAILNGTRGDGFWNDITDVEIVDDQTVAFTLKEGQPLELAMNDILGNIIVYPSSVYGQFATDELAKDVKTYYRAAHKDPEKASKMDEFQRMGDAFKELAAHKVDKLIGNGPFTLENITTKEAKLDKWDGFWAADKIKFAGIDYFNGDAQAIYPQMLSGNLDLTNAYLPPPILKRWKGTQDAHTALPLGFGFVLGFNSSKYPLDMKEVRQALAYVIPRQQISDAAYGTDPAAGGSWKEINTGISPTLEERYLTKEQLGQLNPYPVDEAKATELLESKGFTKKGDQWMMPNGKPFTLTFTVNSATADIVTSFTSASKALNSFGIESEVNATSGAQQDADQHNGDFEAGMYFVGGSNPLGMYNAMMGPDQNFSNTGNYAGKRGIGFGPKMEVPDLGTVNVPATLDEQATGVAPGQQMKDLTWSWAQLVNEEVPYIWYATKVYQFPYSTKSFDNWPPMDDNGTSELWNIIANNSNAGLSLAMQQGYITPKS